MINNPPTTFDPWTSSAAEALRAHEQHTGDGPGPLAQHQVALQVLAVRGACLAPDGGCEVLRCMAVCMANRLSVPGWLAGRRLRSPTSGAGSGDTNIFHFNVGDVASVSMVKQAIAASQAQAAGRLGRSRSYGGAFS